jgi:hypothetical protein
MSEFQDLKAGDEVVLVSRGLGKDKYLLKQVDRVTKTQIVIGNSKYNRVNGFEAGSNSWYRDSLKMPTEDALKKVQEYNQFVLKWHLMKDFQDIDWDKFSFEQLKQIEAFINSLETAVKDSNNE